MVTKYLQTWRFSVITGRVATFYNQAGSARLTRADFSEQSKFMCVVVGVTVAVVGAVAIAVCCCVLMFVAVGDGDVVSVDCGVVVL